MSVRRPVPAGLRLVADPSLVRRDSGRVLIGGSPFRMMRLSEAGARTVDRWIDGAPVRTGAEATLARRLLDAGSMHPLVSPAADRDATVVTPVRDEPALTTLPTGDRPTIVVDDGSSPPIGPIDGARVIRRDVSGGPGAARTDGLALARAEGAEFVAFVDADVTVDPEADPSGSDWIDRLLGHFHDPAVAAVAPRVVSAPGDTILAAYEETFSPLDLGNAPSLVAPGRRVSYVPTAARIVRVAAIDAVGGFDEALRSGEDVARVWRLASAGHAVRYDPSVVVQHRRARRGVPGSGSACPTVRLRHRSPADTVTRLRPVEHPSSCTARSPLPWSHREHLLQAQPPPRSPQPRSASPSAWGTSPAGRRERSDGPGIRLDRRCNPTCVGPVGARRRGRTAPTATTCCDGDDCCRRRGASAPPSGRPLPGDDGPTRRPPRLRRRGVAGRRA